MKETDKSRKLEDRILGDEWLDWQPGKGYEGVIEAPKALFIAFSCAALIFILLGILLFWYLVLPRLKELGTGVAHTTGIAFSSFGVLLSLWYALQVLSSVFKVKLIPASIVKRFPLRLLFSVSVRLAKPFGISRDRIGNSFVKFHNDLMCATNAGRNAKRFLLLLPRCLSAETRKQINELCNRYQCKAFTAFGGDEARKIVREERPAAVIGVACERDLLAGIQDTAPKIPVLGLPNKRPEGPCKNTSVDIKELEELIRFCSGV